MKERQERRKKRERVVEKRIVLNEKTIHLKKMCCRLCRMMS